MVERLCAYMRMKVNINNRQYGFTESRGTDDAWMHVKKSVREARKKYIMGIFVDFQV